MEDGQDLVLGPDLKIVRLARAQLVAAPEEVEDLRLGLGHGRLGRRLRRDGQPGALGGVHLERGGVGDQDDVVLAQAEEAPLLGEDADDPKAIAVDHQRRFDQVVPRTELAGDVAPDHADPVPLLDVDHAKRPARGDLVVPDRRVLGRHPFQDRGHLGSPCADPDRGATEERRDPAQGVAVAIHGEDVGQVQLDPPQRPPRFAVGPLGPDPHRIRAEPLQRTPRRTRSTPGPR